MGALSCCCCTKDDCSGVFDIPEGTKTVTLTATGNHPFTKSQSLVLTRTAISPCRSTTSGNIDLEWNSGLMTSTVDIVTTYDFERSLCCSGVEKIFQDGDYEWHHYSFVAARMQIRFCSFTVAIAAVKETIDGVPTCGIRVTVRLNLKPFATGGSETLIESLLNFTQRTVPLSLCTDQTPTSTTVYRDCQTGDEIFAFNDPPTIPDYPEATVECTGTCYIERSVFVASQTLPSSVTLPNDASDTTTCMDSIYFSQCDYRGLTTIGTIAATSCFPARTQYNLFELCDGTGESGTIYCGGAITSSEVKIISPSRTVTTTASHADETVLFDPFVDPWELEIV